MPSAPIAFLHCLHLRADVTARRGNSSETLQGHVADAGLTSAPEYRP